MSLVREGDQRYTQAGKSVVAPERAVYRFGVNSTVHNEEKSVLPAASKELLVRIDNLHTWINSKSLDDAQKVDLKQQLDYYISLYTHPPIMPAGYQLSQVVGQVGEHNSNLPRIPVGTYVITREDSSPQVMVSYREGNRGVFNLNDKGKIDPFKAIKLPLKDIVFSDIPEVAVDQMNKRMGLKKAYGIREF